MEMYHQPQSAAFSGQLVGLQIGQDAAKSLASGSILKLRVRLLQKVDVTRVDDARVSVRFYHRFKCYQSDLLARRWNDHCGCNCDLG